MLRQDVADTPPSGSGDSRVARELDDALYYLRHDCAPCAERHFDLARRYGASEQQIESVRAAAR